MNQQRKAVFTDVPLGKFVLDSQGNPVLETDTLKWGLWFEHADRTVQRDEIEGVVVSTVFLGLDHFFGPREPHEAVLWETMIFGGELDDYQRRYSSLDDAIAGHMEAVELVNRWRLDVVELRRILSVKYEPR